MMIAVVMGSRMTDDNLIPAQVELKLRALAILDVKLRFSFFYPIIKVLIKVG